MIKIDEKKIMNLLNAGAMEELKSYIRQETFLQTKVVDKSHATKIKNFLATVKKYRVLERPATRSFVILDGVAYFSNAYFIIGLQLQAQDIEILKASEFYTEDATIISTYKSFLKMYEYDFNNLAFDMELYSNLKLNKAKVYDKEDLDFAFSMDYLKVAEKFLSLDKCSLQKYRHFFLFQDIDTSILILGVRKN